MVVARKSNGLTEGENSIILDTVENRDDKRNGGCLSRTAKATCQLRISLYNTKSCVA